MKQTKTKQNKTKRKKVFRQLQGKFAGSNPECFVDFITGCHLCFNSRLSKPFFCSTVKQGGLLPPCELKKLTLRYVYLVLNLQNSRFSASMVKHLQKFKNTKLSLKISSFRTILDFWKKKMAFLTHTHSIKNFFKMAILNTSRFYMYFNKRWLPPLYQRLWRVTLSLREEVWSYFFAKVWVMITYILCLVNKRSVLPHQDEEMGNLFKDKILTREFPNLYRKISYSYFGWCIKLWNTPKGKKTRDV